MQKAGDRPEAKKPAAAEKNVKGAGWEHRPESITGKWENHRHPAIRETDLEVPNNTPTPPPRITKE